MWYTKIYGGEQGINKLYSTLNNGLGDLYKFGSSLTISGTGSFPILSAQGLVENITNTYGIDVTPEGNTYRSVIGGDIYYREGTEGPFTALGQTARSWWSICGAPNGNVYATVAVNPAGEDIYMQTNGVGDFEPLGQTFRIWTDIESDANNNVYASTSNGDVYKQTNGIGDFEPLGFSGGQRYITCHFNGDIYYTFANWPTLKIQKQVGGAGALIDLDIDVPLTGLPTGITHTANGDVYVSVTSKIYRQKAAEGPFKLLPHTPATIWRTITSYEDTVYLVSSIISPKDIFTFDANGPLEYSVPKKGWLYDNLNRPLFNMYENGIEDV